MSMTGFHVIEGYEYWCEKAVAFELSSQRTALKDMKEKWQRPQTQHPGPVLQ